ncbi:glutaredoxin family protein [Caryophanon latum]|uniref:Uncharacterized protein n=1 Tax=Caryophanon latum TaxID=33977 RepID=A0A1C0YWW6_9BACL|nr:glutaredoxin family protein [Caryophanon latum]OCS91653.1 hypothetical protein A6K76_08385 [Caryophanon latum]
MELLLYTRPNCPLCDDAKQLLHLLQDDFSFTWQEVNIEENDALHEQFCIMIPVIVHNGDILQQGNVDYIELEEAITARL